MSVERQPRRPIDATPEAAIRAMQDLSLEVRQLRAELRELRLSAADLVAGIKGAGVGGGLLGLLAKLGGRR